MADERTKPEARPQDDPTRPEAALALAEFEQSLVLTGGPGSGKTTTLDEIRRRLAATGKRVAVMSPTGQGAQNLHETGQTMHSGLKLSTVNCVDPDGNAALFFQNGADRRELTETLRKIDVLMIDELPMASPAFLDRAIAAIEELLGQEFLETGITLIAAGDPSQLRPVVFQIAEQATAELPRNRADRNIAAIRSPGMHGRGNRIEETPRQRDARRHDQLCEQRYGEARTVFAARALQGLPVVALSASHRFAADPAWGAALQRIERSAATAQDQHDLDAVTQRNWRTIDQVLKGLATENPQGIADYDMILCYENADARRVNDAYVEARDQPDATVRLRAPHGPIRLPKADGGAIATSDADINRMMAYRCDNYYPMMDLALGMPIMFRHNSLGADETHPDVTHDHGWANGTRGWLRALGWPAATLTNFGEEGITELAGTLTDPAGRWPDLKVPKRMQGTGTNGQRGFTISGDTPKAASLYRRLQAVIEVPRPLGGTRFIRITPMVRQGFHRPDGAQRAQKIDLLTQLPIVPAVGMTCYMGQGRTNPAGKRTLVLTTGLDQCPGGLFMCLSRSSRRTDLTIAGDCPPANEIGGTPDREYIDHFVTTGMATAETALRGLPEVQPMPTAKRKAAEPRRTATRQR